MLLRVTVVTDQMLHCEVETFEHWLLYIAFIYAASTKDERIKLWNDLRALQVSTR